MRDFSSEPTESPRPKRIREIIERIISWIGYVSFASFGCVGALVLVIFGFWAIPIVISFFHTATGHPPHLPEKITVSGTYLSQDKIGGFLEGCVFESYELAPETVSAIEHSGLTFFKDMPQPVDVASKFGPWRITPVPNEPYVFASGALNGCQNDNSVRDAIGYVGTSEQGNYYSLSSNREGIILVFPKRRLVVFAYFG